MARKSAKGMMLHAEGPHHTWGSSRGSVLDLQCAHQDFSRHKPNSNLLSLSSTWLYGLMPGAKSDSR